MNRSVVTACVALGTSGVLAAGMSDAAAHGRAAQIDSERGLVVTLVTPAIGQAVLPDMSDPGLNNVISVRFSNSVNARDIIDGQNAVNRLSAKCEFLGADLRPLRGTPSVSRNVVTFDPFSLAVPVLPQGQYTLNLKSSIRNMRGRLLNNGREDFTATFSVGTDTYPPVLRRTSPISGATGIGLQQQIVATFNEPIDPASLLGTLFLQDGSTDPPTAVAATFALARRGFDLVVTPDPCFGYPPKTNIQFIIQGQAAPAQVTSSCVTDLFQNKLTRDISLPWTRDATTATLYHSPLGDFDKRNGQFILRFETKGVKPPPASPAPGGPMMNYPPPYASPCAPQLWLAPSCEVSGNCVHFTTNTGLGVMDLRQYIARFDQGVTDHSLISILANTPVRTGRPGGATFDPRIIGPGHGASSFHTFLYLVDERTATVQVVRSDNLEVIGRLAGFSSPRDVSISTNTAQSATTLYVTDFRANQLVAIDFGGIAVSFGGPPGAPSPCDAIKDDRPQRAFISVGAGPTDVSADSFLQQRAMVCNSLDDSVSVIDVRTNKVLKTIDSGSNPVSCDWNTIRFGVIKVAMIANQGGLNDPDGSVGLYMNRPPLNSGFLGAGQAREGLESTLTDGVKNPTHVWGNVKWIDPPPPIATLTSVPIVWWVSNTGGSTVIDVRLSVAGIFGLSITPSVNATISTGRNPSSTVMDAFHPNAIVFSSVLGTGAVTVSDPGRAIPPAAIPVPGIRRLYNCFTN